MVHTDNLNRRARGALPWQFACLLVATLLSTPQACLAQNNSADTFVTRSFGGRDVLRVTTALEIPPSLAFGNAVVDIVCPTGPSKADRQLEVVFYLKDMRSNHTSAAYHKMVVLPEGATSCRVELPHTQISKTQNWSTGLWDVAVFEEGRDIEDRRRQGRNQPAFNYIQSSRDTRNSIGMIVGDDQSIATAEDDLAYLSDLLNNTTVITATVNSMGVSTEPGVALSASDVSGDWRRYLAYSTWYLSASAVSDLSQSNVSGREAIVDYVAAGGNVLLFGKTKEMVDASSKALFGQHTAGASSINSDLRSFDYLGGRVLLASKPIGALRESTVKASLGSLTPNSLSNVTSDGEDANWFWRNLIRTVGKPPIWTFCAAIAIFSLILGPGLLAVTGWLGRRSLMIFLVPALALLATLLIIGYGILYEGFETHRRVTSVIRVDPETGNGFAWSRQNYFSGLPPRAGITFGLHTYVRPVFGDEGNYHSGSPRQNVRTHIYLGEEQRWRGWLRPRQQQQLLVGHSIRSAAFPLEVVASTDSRIEIRNLSSATVPVVLLRGAKDDYYVATDLESGSSSLLEAEDSDTVRSTIAKLMGDLRPRQPPELQEGGSLLNFRNRGRSTSSEGGDIINLTYKKYMSDRFEIPNYGVAALLTESDLVEVPLEGQTADNLHLVVGELKW